MDGSPQVILAAHGRHWHKKTIWQDSLAVPTYAATISVVVLLLHLVIVSRPVQKLWARVSPPKDEDFDAVAAQDESPIPAEGVVAETKAFVQSHGGPVHFVYKILRLLGCFAFLGICAATFVFEEGLAEDSDLTLLLRKHRKDPKPDQTQSAFSDEEWLQFALCMTATYASLLALISVGTRPRWSKLISNHLATILLVTFAVFIYRDIYPLLTFTKQPQDVQEGWLLWSRLIVLGLIAVVFPLVFPRQYIPEDPTDPSSEPHPEQTSSWLSMFLYLWLDPIVLLAYRVPHLSVNHLPPLADHDRSALLMKRSLPHLDPFSGSKRRHIFFGFLNIFGVDFCVLALTVSLQAIFSLSAPFAIKNLLEYLETKGLGAVFRPWVWIAVLFLGPMASSLVFQWYIFIATRLLVRTEGIITQLVFQHALRIRMKAELPDSKSPDGMNTPSEASETASLADSTISVGEDNTVANEAQVHSSAASVTSSRKGKQRAASAHSRATSTASVPADYKPESSSDNLIGKINNLVSTDLSNITDGRDFLLCFLYIPLQVGLCMVFLYQILGWSALVGLAIMAVTFPLPGYVAKLIQTTQKQKMKRTDARVQSVTETMNVLRMIKLFGWESRMDEKISEKREDELIFTWRQKVLELVNNNLNFIIPILVMLATYATYTLIMKETLSAGKVFSSMSVFDIMRDQLHMVFYMVPKMMQAKVSLDRVNDFLFDTELLDIYTEDDEAALLFPPDEDKSDEIGFRDAKFSWSSEGSGALTPSKRKFNLRIEDEILFKRGRINLIVGPTGSGKTSLLMALLGEMHFIPYSPNSWFNLPRKGGVSYAAQESWVQNETIRDNILFGAPYDEARYKKVLYQCALERDLTLFEAGDQTEVGEKGLTLSGGQKARVTLARAIYSSAEIILLDDVLAALDVHTAKWVVDKCLGGDMVKGRTVILVTHNVAMASTVAQFVVSLGSNGRVLSTGTISDAVTADSGVAADMVNEQELIEKDEEVIDAPAEGETKAGPKADGKLIVAEEVAEGHVSWAAIKLFLTSLGGQYPVLFWFTFIGFMGLTDLINTIQTWFLGQWAAQYEIKSPSEVNVTFYLSGYSILLLLATIFFTTAYALYYWGSMRASRILHQKLISSVLGTTLRWLDTTPTSRVITRCTQDVRAVDGPFAQGIGWMVELTMTMLVKLGAVVAFTPIFLIPGSFVAAIGGWIGRIYMKAQLSVKREMSNAKAPVMGHFGAAINGLPSIRAYGAEEAFKRESLKRIDRYTTTGRMFYNLNRWVCIRIDGFGAIFSAGLAAYLVYGRQDLQASNIGFSLNMAVGFSSMILWWVRILNEVEVNGNSLERIEGYITIEQEPKPTEGGQPPAYWPSSGDLRVEGLTARYSSDGPKVLKNLDFHIKSGERVGIVGRTGSGKSSLTLSLLRCIFTEGQVYYDGIPTSSLNLDALRSNITIIPQVPELLSGTLRQNLDPFDQHDDAVLNDALRSSGLYSVQEEDEESKLTLDSAIASGGGNLSVGQRQILALARAMVRGSKLLILDEATSAIDYKTDTAIQESLRQELKRGITQIIVAHRLQTIIDADKIMVLDAGCLVEFGSPWELLQNERGKFRALVDESGDKDALYDTARNADASGSS
ncbi:hypothetical protein CONPUDRAFT_78742 [Coniophora puteana RWD-64-598 SS2]|uniref:P-loop containing nucleoside triphosphate hydrolase protein n=1 Tax=Coniophora puteana (strain RWD-64-598) TaxID=741705 RepID=A0A5M3N4Q2_CONPW|nr:uncharacterized protein CONPUDRAFT_78742 [Coniophora puteana RWD-64-598 SS2]EIW86373.1 hypothetical protein CONPUDRAFT_78742 [Coniophora puteana RWD-64-598 SS2]